MQRLRAAIAPRPSDVPILGATTLLFAGLALLSLTPLPGWTVILSLLFLPAWIWAAFRAQRYVAYRRGRLLLVVAIALAIPLANVVFGSGTIARSDIAWLVLGLSNAAIFAVATWRALRLHRGGAVRDQAQ